MLDTFLKVAYERSSREKQEDETVEALRKLPIGELAKIASGGSVPWLEEKSAFVSLGCENTFLGQFKGTDLFSRAVELEQAELEAEAAEIQERQKRRSEPNSDRLWDLRDGIRLKKKLLELELAKSQNGMSGAETQGVEAVPPEAAGSVQQGVMGSVGTKTSSLNLALFADRLGREIAQSDMQKAASVVDQKVQRLIHVGKMPEKAQGFFARGKEVLTGSRHKEVSADINQKIKDYHRDAYNNKGRYSGWDFADTPEARVYAVEHLKSLGARAGLLGTAGAVGYGGYKALRSKPPAPTEQQQQVQPKLAFDVGAAWKATRAVLHANPRTTGMVAGGVLGGVGGAAAGGPDNRISGALGGAVLGTAGGAFGGNVYKHMRPIEGQGKAFSDAVGATAHDIADSGVKHYETARDYLKSKFGNPGGT